MSHYFVVVLTETGTEEEVAELLAPYDENLKVAPYKEFVDDEEWFKSTMRKHYPIAEEAPLEDYLPHIKDFTGQAGGIEDGRLFTWSTYNPASRWDWYSIGGRWNGVITNQPVDDDKYGFNHDEEFRRIENNRCLVSHLPEDLDCFAIVTPDGVWYSEGKMGWFGSSTTEDNDWDSNRKMILSQHPDAYAVGCDLHI